MVTCRLRKSLPSSLFGLWNLDFFRPYYSDVCLGIGILPTLALDYAIALFPLLLMILTYLLIVLYDKNYGLIRKMWEPFQQLFSLFKKNWNIRTSVIDAFSTFFLLSNIKFLTVSFDLLVPTKVYRLYPDHYNYTWGLYYAADRVLRKGASSLCNLGYSCDVCLCNSSHNSSCRLSIQLLPEALALIPVPPIRDHSSHIHGRIPRLLQEWNGTWHSRLPVVFICVLLRSIHSLRGLWLHTQRCILRSWCCGPNPSCPTHNDGAALQTFTVLPKSQQCCLHTAPCFEFHQHLLCHAIWSLYFQVCGFLLRTLLYYRGGFVALCICDIIWLDLQEESVQPEAATKEEKWLCGAARAC